jgi:hypothetical protein
MLVPGRRFCWSSGGDGVEHVVATFTGQADMRGLVTAGRSVREGAVPQV